MHTNPGTQAYINLMDYLSTNFIKYQTQQKCTPPHITSKSLTEPLETQQPGNLRDADPVKNRLRANQLKYRLNRSVDDRRYRNKHQIVHCVGRGGVVPSAAQAEYLMLYPTSLSI